MGKIIDRIVSFIGFVVFLLAGIGAFVYAYDYHHWGAGILAAVCIVLSAMLADRVGA